MERGTRIRRFQEIDSAFIDFKKFEDDGDRRQLQREAFVGNEVWTPEYHYPNLDTLYDLKKLKNGEEFLEERKTRIYEAVLELEAARELGEVSEAEIELWASFHENRLKKILLVEAARRLHHEANSSAIPTLRREFAVLNEEVYGEFDTEAFAGIMASEQELVADFTPRNKQAAEVNEWLSRYFDRYDYGEAIERPLLDEQLMQKMREKVFERYQDILVVVPDTDDSVIYNAKESQAIMQVALEAGGLAQQGWAVEVNPKKLNPSTSTDSQKIYLPSNTQRTAAQLRRLIIHEQEVHARRGQNGLDKESSLLAKGTASYADVEEGLGVILECVVAGDMDNESYHRARDRYIVAGLALGTDGTPRDARATYETAWRVIALREAKDGIIDETIIGSAKNRAMKHVENAFRGTDFVSPGVIYSKLKVYYEGLAKNAHFFKEYEDNLDDAFDIAMIGKFDHTDEVERDNIQQLYGFAA